MAPRISEWLQYTTTAWTNFDEQGRLVEHWDVLQRVPVESANPNTMF